MRVSFRNAFSQSVLFRERKGVNIASDFLRMVVGDSASCSIAEIIGSLSNSVFKRRTSTGSGLFSSLGSGLVKTLW